MISRKGPSIHSLLSASSRQQSKKGKTTKQGQTESNLDQLQFGGLGALEAHFIPGVAGVSAGLYPAVRITILWTDLFQTS